jgi:hypothetical protein
MDQLLPPAIRDKPGWLIGLLRDMVVDTTPQQFSIDKRCIPRSYRAPGNEVEVRALRCTCAFPEPAAMLLQNAGRAFLARTYQSQKAGQLGHLLCMIAGLPRFYYPRHPRRGARPPVLTAMPSKNVGRPFIFEFTLSAQWSMPGLKWKPPSNRALACAG